MTRVFYSERDLDEIGLYSKAHRERLIKAGKFPAPVQLGGPNGKRLYPREAIEALLNKREAASA